MRTKQVLLALIVALAGISGGVIAATGTGPSDSVNNLGDFNNTTLLDSNHTENASLVNNISVEDPYASNTTATLVSNDNVTYEVNLNYSEGNASNATVYVASSHLDNEDINNSTVEVDGEQVNFTEVTHNNTSYYGLNVEELDNDTTVVFQVAATGGSSSADDGIISTVTSFVTGNPLMLGAGALILVIGGFVAYRRFYSTAAADDIYLD